MSDWVTTEYDYAGRPKARIRLETAATNAHQLPPHLHHLSAPMQVWEYVFYLQNVNRGFANALEDIIGTIGPKPATCMDCEGCRCEVDEALHIARDALARPVGRATKSGD